MNNQERDEAIAKLQERLKTEESDAQPIVTVEQFTALNEQVLKISIHVNTLIERVIALETEFAAIKTSVSTEPSTTADPVEPTEPAEKEA